MTTTSRTFPVGAAHRLRRPIATDAPRLADLCTQLGYPSTPDEIATRFASLDASHDLVLIAVDEQDGALGWIQASVIRHLHENAHVEITGMVVTEDARGSGIGAALVAGAETWATEAGITRVLVRSNVVRERAHAFYERLGYARHKTSHVFEKALGRSAGRDQRNHDTEGSS